MQHLGSGHCWLRGLSLIPLPFEPGEGSSRIIELNHMFLRLCGPPSIPLSFTVAGVLPRWNTYRFRLATQDPFVPDGEYSSFTVRTTRGSNPVRYPHFRASASVGGWHAAFAIGVLRDIYAFHRYTSHSACLAATQDRQFQRLYGVEPRIITAAAGTELADAFSPGTLTCGHVRSVAPRQKRFTTRRAVFPHAPWLVQARAH